MRILLTPNNKARLEAVNKRQMSMQGRALNESERLCADWQLTFPQGKYQPHHFPSPYLGIKEVITKINKAGVLQDIESVLDPGSGLGMAVFGLASLTNNTGKPVFNKITGIEQDPNYHALAETARNEYKFDNVTLIHNNFLKEKPYKYDMLYMYWPFGSRHFGRLMRKWMKDILPESIIISFTYDHKEDRLFPKSSYRPLLGRAEIQTSEGYFYAYRRR